MSVDCRDFGQTRQGQNTKLYHITDRDNGLAVDVTDYGACVVSVFAPNRDGEHTDVVLGYEDAAEYEAGGSYYGALVGRNANRIKDAEFLIGGKRYILFKNDGDNNLHSGPDTWNKRLWQVTETGERSVRMELFSPDLDQGFPGDLEVAVTYTVRGTRFEIDYEARPDRDTVVNLTNHSYFNLNGHDGGSVLDHLVKINADFYTETAPDLIPTGRLIPVAGTPYDFTQRRRLGEFIEPGGELPAGMIRLYDTNFALQTEGMGLAANCYSQQTGILMNVYTDLPGMQMYTPDTPGSVGKGGAVYGAYGAVCFETQYFPDAVHQPNFAGPIVRAGEVFRSRTVYEFDTVTV